MTHARTNLEIFLRGELRPWIRLARCLAFASALILSWFASAQGATGDHPTSAESLLAPEVSVLLVAHPPGSIRSIEVADKALSDAKQARSIIEAQHAHDQRECHPKFFTTDCLDKVKERRRVAIAKVRAIEVEANSYKRRARVIERDKALEQRRNKDESNAPERLKMQTEAEARISSRDPMSSPQPAQSIETAAEAATERKVASKSAPRPDPKPRARKVQQKIDAATQAKNIAAYDKKLADAAAHQRAIATRKAEKEAERARKTGAKDAGAGSPVTTVTGAAKIEKK